MHSRTGLWYAILGQTSGELYSIDGNVIIHDHPGELDFLVKYVGKMYKMKGRDAEEVASWLGRPVVCLRDHPNMVGVTWPLSKQDFWAE
jgi:hypothetical protein